MSIAVSALVRPSRVHRCLLGACALVQCGVTLALALGVPFPYLGGPLLALLPALAAASLAVAAARSPKTHRIDISGTGDLRVTVQQDVGDNAAVNAETEAATKATLLPGSSIWPLLMVLRYGEPGGRAQVLVVGRDGVDLPAWRGLAVALATLGGCAQTDTEHDNKIKHAAGRATRRRRGPWGTQQDMFSDDRTRK